MLDWGLSAIPADDPEVKREMGVNVIVKDSKNPTDSLMNYLSSWRKLKMSAAWFLKIKRLLLLLQKRKEIQTALSMSKNAWENAELQGHTQRTRFNSRRF